MRWRMTIAAALLGTGVASAATFQVTKTADTNDGSCNLDCSLREAVILANGLPGADLILVPAGTYTLTVSGVGEDFAATGDLDIREGVQIRGAGAASTIVDGNGIDRVFDVRFGSPTTIADLTIRGGSADTGAGVHNQQTLRLTSVVIRENFAATDGGGIFTENILHLHNGIVSDNVAGGDGGGIYNSDEANLVRSTVSGNTAARGGGIWSNSLQTLLGSTVSGNEAGSIGGGIYNSDTLTIENSTCSGNVATTRGGCIYNDAGSVSLSSSTIHDNTAGFQNEGSAVYHDYPGATPSMTFANTIVTGPGACFTPTSFFTSSGGNLESPGATCGFGALIPSDQANVPSPGLSPLQDNGGPTLTHRPLAGSAAIGGGNPSSCPPPSVDQRGAQRTVVCDSGAVEAEFSAPFFADGFESGDDAVWSSRVPLD